MCDSLVTLETLKILEILGILVLSLSCINSASNLLEILDLLFSCINSASNSFALLMDIILVFLFLVHFLVLYLFLPDCMMKSQYFVNYCYSLNRHTMYLTILIINLNSCINPQIR